MGFILRPLGLFVLGGFLFVSQTLGPGILASVDFCVDRCRFFFVWGKGGIITSKASIPGMVL